MALTGEISPVSLMEEAAALADGDSGWGDLHFVEPLQLLLQSRGGMTPFGWEILRRVVIRRLVNRLQVAAHVTAHPEVEQRPLQVTAVITGLPRTGTTVLHNLLARDPDHRVLRLWEALHPVPPDANGRYSRPELVRQAERWLARMYELVPSFPSIHPGSAEGPEECDVLLQNGFASQHFDDMFDSPAYSSWLYGGSLSREYAHYALQLRVLSDSDAAWVLKSPSHLAHLEALVATLPGPLIVWCHRDPRQAVASWSSLIHAVRSPHYESVSRKEVGRQALERAARAVARGLDVHGRLGPERILDIPYRLIESDPLAAVGRIYERMERRLSPGAQAAMGEWLDAHPQHRHGIHRYDLAEFGLTGDEVDARFEPYLSRCGGLVGC